MIPIWAEWLVNLILFCWEMWRWFSQVGSITMRIAASMISMMAWGFMGIWIDLWMGVVVGLLVWAGEDLVRK